MVLRPLIFSFVVAPALAVAQQPFPTYTDNGTWSVLQCITGSGTTCITTTQTYAEANTFCGHTWSTYTWPTFGSPNVAHLRNDGLRTLLRRSMDCLDKEYVIYDFSMEVGDSVYAALNMDLPGQDTALFVLQAIDTVEILGVDRRRFSLLFNLCNQDMVSTPMEWIEGIGSTMHPFYSVDCLCYLCQQSFTLLCYDSSGVQLYVNPVFNTCDTLLTTIHEAETVPTSGLQVIYDAAAGTLRVLRAWNGRDEMASRHSLMLITADGRTAVHHDLEGAAIHGALMDVSRVAPGAYVVVLTDGRTRLAGHRVVIE
ncbi:MAG: hypothetical protein IPM46_01535 [Flavobacteriales bacterium]|nr:hypothetical protein [Flavobacteriales bacterium]